MLLVVGSIQCHYSKVGSSQAVLCGSMKRCLLNRVMQYLSRESLLWKHSGQSGALQVLYRQHCYRKAGQHFHGHFKECQGGVLAGTKRHGRHEVLGLTVQHSAESNLCCSFGQISSGSLRSRSRFCSILQQL